MKILVKKFEEKDFSFNEWNYVTIAQLKSGRIITITDPSYEGYFGDDVGKWVSFLLKISLFQFQKIRGNNNIEPEDHYSLSVEENMIFQGKFLDNYTIPKKYEKLFYLDSRITIGELYEKGVKAIETIDGVFLFDNSYHRIDRLKEKYKIEDGNMIEIAIFDFDYVARIWRY